MQAKKKKVLILGGLGFIGYNLATYLDTLIKYEIIISDIKSLEEDIDTTNDYNNTVFHNLSYRRVNIENKTSLNILFSTVKPDVVINFAAKTGVLESEYDVTGYFNTNVIGNMNVVEMCSSHNVEHLIHASSSCVYKESYSNFKETFKLAPKSFYGKTKHRNEDQIKGAKVIDKSTILRLFNVYGENFSRGNMMIPKFIRSLKDNTDITLRNKGKNKRDIIHVDDVCLLVEKVIKSKRKYKFEIFNVGSGDSKSVLKYYNKLLNKYNPKFSKLYLTRKNEIELRKTQANIDKAKEYFNWKPKINVYENI